MPEISIIVPVYGVEAYLPRCLNSILAQSFTDYELILVDDGSPDQCGEICDAYREKDARVRVIHQENGGISAARNAGIELATGEWLTFVDSDDYLHPEMLGALYGAVQQHGVSLSVCSHVLTKGESLVRDVDLTVKLWTPADYYLQEQVNATVAWGKLYKRELFQDLRYPKGKIHEDEFLTYRLLFACEKIAVVEAPLYGYFYNEQGIMRRKWNPGRLAMLEAVQEQISYFLKHGHPQLAKRQYLIGVEVCKASLRHLQAFEDKAERKKHRKFCLDMWKTLMTTHKRELHITLVDFCDFYAAAYPNLKVLFSAIAHARILTGKLARKALGVFAAK